MPPVRRQFCSVVFQELYDNPAELGGFFEIHEMANVTDHHAAGSRNTGFDGARVRLDVRNVGVANKQKGWNVNLSQTRQCGLHREFKFWMCEVLWIGGENFCHPFSGGVTAGCS